MSVIKSNKEQSKIKAMSRKNLYYSAFSASLLFLAIGCVTAWPSASLSLLQKHGLTSTQQTWMVSLSMLGSVLGPTVYSIVIDRLGRKYTLLISSMIFIVSWIILALGDCHPYLLYAGRFIGGLANGVTISTVPIYVTEISDADMRQTLASMTSPFCSLGLFIEYAAGPWLSYEIMVLVSAIPPILFAITWIRLPESPYHLVAKGKIEQATKTLIWLRGDQDVSEELHQIEGLVEELKNKTGRKLDLIQKRGPRRALMLSSLMLFFQPFSGVDVVASYLDPILASTSLSISHQLATVIIGGINSVCSIFEPFVVHRFGSKWVMVLCSFLCSFFLLIFGVYKFFDERHYNLSSISFFPLACIILFELFYGVGYGTLPWAISAELFPPSLKGFANNLVTTMNCIMAFVATTFYGDLSPIIGASLCFIISAVFFIFGDILIAILLPNTQGLSLDKVQELLERK